MAPEGPATLRLTTRLEPRGPAGAVVLTDAQVKLLAGSAKTPPVRVTVGGATVRGRVARMNGEILIGVSKASRAALGIAVGDEIVVEIALDDQPREVDVPEALAAALADDPTARAAFDALSYTGRKEIARAIAEAERPETRERRLADALARLHGG